MKQHPETYVATDGSLWHVLHQPYPAPLRGPEWAYWPDPAEALRYRAGTAVTREGAFAGAELAVREAREDLAAGRPVASWHESVLGGHYASLGGGWSAHVDAVTGIGPYFARISGPGLESWRSPAYQRLDRAQREAELYVQRATAPAEVAS